MSGFYLRTKCVACFNAKRGGAGCTRALSFGWAPADLGFGDWQAHGFLSQGYTYTSANDFFGNSQGGRAAWSSTSSA